MSRNTGYTQGSGKGAIRSAATQASYTRQRMQAAYQEARYDLTHPPQSAISMKLVMLGLFSAIALASLAGGFLTLS